MAKYGPYICTHCLHDDDAEHKGSFVLIVLLLCLFIIPGIIYILWCLSSGKVVCPKCHHHAMIPISSPKGWKLIVEQYGSHVIEHQKKIKERKRKMLHAFLIICILAALFHLSSLLIARF